MPKGIKIYFAGLFTVALTSFILLLINITFDIFKSVPNANFGLMGLAMLCGVLAWVPTLYLMITED
jgi:hypothetical protein